jgi:hypothetical protein
MPWSWSDHPVLPPELHDSTADEIDWKVGPHRGELFGRDEHGVGGHGFSFLLPSLVEKGIH